MIFERAMSLRALRERSRSRSARFGLRAAKEEKLKTDSSKRVAPQTEEEDGALPDDPASGRQRRDRPMPMDRTVAHLNVEHFHHLLERETDETKRKMILRLLAEEEAKLKAMAKPSAEED